MEHIVPILSITPITHNVKQIRIKKPSNYQFVPGQATEVSINKENWREEKRPFTFTCLEDEPYLEFVIKSYRDHPGVTNEIDQLKAGDELVVRDVWGAIQYQGEGYFIAGGAGITPFIAILRKLKRDNAVGNNRLFFSNRTARDIILKDELTGILGERATFILTEEDQEKKKSIRINEEYLLKNVTDFKTHFYICGPDVMVSELNQLLIKLGARPDLVVFEK
ncbi:MAG: FAD-binding oxidoreductase [Flavisolibacter sp.]